MLELDQFLYLYLQFSCTFLFRLNEQFKTHFSTRFDSIKICSSRTSLCVKFEDTSSFVQKNILTLLLAISNLLTGCRVTLNTLLHCWEKLIFVLEIRALNKYQINIKMSKSYSIEIILTDLFYDSLKIWHCLLQFGIAYACWNDLYSQFIIY